MIKRIKDTIAQYVNMLKGEDLRGQLINNSIRSVFLNGGSKILSFLIGTFLVRLLGDDGYGVYSYVFSLAYILIIPAEFGISTLLLRETSKGQVKEDNDTISGSWRWSFRATLLVSFILLLVGAASGMIGKQFFGSVETSTFFWGLLLLPLQSLVILINAALRGLKKVIIGQIPDLWITPGLFTVLIIGIGYLSKLDFTPPVAMALRVVSTFVAVVASVFFLFKYTPKAILQAKPIYHSKIWLSSVIPLIFSSGINLVRSRTNIIVLGFFVDSAAIGSFQVALSTATLASVVLTAINSIIAPQFTSLHTNGDKNKLQRLTVLSARFVFVLNLLISALFIIFGKNLLTLVFGTKLIAAYPALVVLLIGQVINSFLGSVNILLNMTGHEKDVMKIIIITSILNIVFTLVLAPLTGMVAGAIAASASMAVSQIWMYIIVRKRIGIVSHIFGKVK
ncbi:oligosaccharide flippase family protein [Chloroflexota bacterium]|nr:oligosaccharide flippase family protein [Chloroflexota bacterium]